MSRKRRRVTAAQLQMGYIVRHAYEVAEDHGDGTYDVYEPEVVPDELLSALEAVENAEGRLRAELERVQTTRARLQRRAAMRIEDLEAEQRT